MASQSISFHPTRGQGARKRACVQSNSVKCREMGFLIIFHPETFCLFSGCNLWMTVLSVGVQGVGTADTFLGALLLMMKGAG